MKPQRIVSGRHGRRRWLPKADARAAAPWFPAARLASGIVIAIAGAWVLYHYPPATSSFYPHCAFHDLTGLDCPGCGTTRALHQLLHGNVRAALRLNAMLFPLMFVGACSTPSILRGRTPDFMMKPWFGWGSFVVIVGWWIGRNVFL